MANNPPKALQGYSASISDGQSLMRMTVATIQKHEIGGVLHLFLMKQNMNIAVFKLQIQQFHVPRKFEVGISVSEAQNSIEVKYHLVYFEVIDYYTVNAIQQRFDQDG